MDESPENSLLDAIEIEPKPEHPENGLGSINSGLSDFKFKEEEKLRKKLKFFFMNPIEKWRFKQRFPYKFFVQLIKILVVTLQASLFAHHRSFYINFVSESRIAFSHLFLEGWDSSREVVSFPPPEGELAVYKVSEFYSAIDYAVINYANLDEAIGSYSYTQNDNSMSPLEFCYRHYKTCDIFGFNESFVFNNNISRSCINITVTKESAQNFSSEEYFRKANVKIQFSALVDAKLYFGVKTINVKPSGPKALPDCYMFGLMVKFDNHANDGKIKLSLGMDVYRLHCKGTINYKNDTQLESVLQSLLNSIVIIFCFISMLLCGRAVYKALVLRRKTIEFFRKYHNMELGVKEKLEFVNWWYLTMISSDIIIIIGSSWKEEIEKSQFSGDEWNICSAMLGTGTFLIWFCVLRYLGFFETYNVIMLTMKVAAPVIFRFLVCTMVIYVGFTFCGWLVLGPYHNKFRTFSVTFECLFALINGDDVFNTFGILEPTESVIIWWFCRIYLYLFISLFIYVVLPLFVSVILDAYETIKRCYTEGFPKDFMQEFIEGNLHGNLFSDSSSSLADDTPPCYPVSFNSCLKSLLSFLCCYRITDTRETTIIHP